MLANSWTITEKVYQGLQRGNPAFLQEHLAAHPEITKVIFAHSYKGYQVNVEAVKTAIQGLIGTKVKGLDISSCSLLRDSIPELLSTMLTLQTPREAQIEVLCIGSLLSHCSKSVWDNLIRPSVPADGAGEEEGIMQLRLTQLDLSNTSFETYGDREKAEFIVRFFELLSQHPTLKFINMGGCTFENTQQLITFLGPLVDNDNQITQIEIITPEIKEKLQKQHKQPLTIEMQVATLKDNLFSGLKNTTADEQTAIVTLLRTLEQRSLTRQRLAQEQRVRTFLRQAVPLVAIKHYRTHALFIGLLVGCIFYLWLGVVAAFITGLLSVALTLWGSQRIQQVRREEMALAYGSNLQTSAQNRTPAQEYAYQLGIQSKDAWGAQLRSYWLFKREASTWWYAGLAHAHILAQPQGQDFENTERQAALSCMPYSN